MTTPGGLVSGMADQLGMSTVYLAAFDRELAQAGLRAKHGRGPAAARMSSDDAAHLLLSVMSGGQAKDAAASVRTYGALSGAIQHSTMASGPKFTRTFDYKSRLGSLGLNLTGVDALHAGHGLVAMVDELIFAAQNGSLEAAAGNRKAGLPVPHLPSEGHWEITIRVRSPQPWAEVLIACDDQLAGVIYGASGSCIAFGGLQREMVIDQNTILGIGRLLRD
jgi:hypothetical protein